MRDQIRAYCINENSNTFSLMQYALIVSDGRLSYGNRDFRRQGVVMVLRDTVKKDCRRRGGGWGRTTRMAN